MADKKIAERGIMRRYVDNGDGTYSEGVAILYGGGGSSGTATTSAATLFYTVAIAFAGADLNDTLSETTILDVSSGEIQSTIWINVTKDTALATVPPSANIVQQASNPLTNAQLRASAVTVAPNVTRGQGTSDANTQRVTLATDSPAVGAVGAAADATATTDSGTFSLVALVKRGLANWTTLLARVPALVSGRMPVASSIPTASTATILALTTSTTGANYVTFGSQACTSLEVVNNTGATIEVRRGGAGVAMQIPPGMARLFLAITNADQLGVRRTDTSNTQVTIQAEAFVN
jgi:hypothetical protein